MTTGARLGSYDDLVLVRGRISPDGEGVRPRLVKEIEAGLQRPLHPRREALLADGGPARSWRGAPSPRRRSPG